MDVRSFEVLAAVMRAGSATRAAEVLRTSQPAVSRTIARLERQLGMRLFARIAGRLVPTEEAALLHQEIEAAFRGLDRVREAAARIRERGSGILRLACLPAMAVRVAPIAIAAFRHVWPKVRVSLEVTDSLTVRDLVASGRADLGLAADEAEPSGLRATLFAEVRAVCVLPADHPLARRGGAVRAADLPGMALLALAPEDAARRRFDALFAEGGLVTPEVAVETPYAATIAALAAEGAGIGVANPLALPATADARLAVRPFEPALRFRTLLLCPAGRESRLSAIMAEELARALAQVVAGDSLVGGAAWSLEDHHVDRGQAQQRRRRTLRDR